MLAVAAAAGRAVAVHRRDRVAPSPAAAPCAARARRRRARSARCPPGRSVSERSLRSVKVYISLCTTSDASPAVRAKSAGVLEPGRLDASVAVAPRELLDRAHEVPPGGVGGQDVVRPARRLELAGSRAALLGAQLAQERVRRELAAERGRRAVPGVDDRLGREALEQAPNRGEQRLPVAAGEIDAADRAREQQVAGRRARRRGGTRRARPSGPGRRRPRT